MSTTRTFFKAVRPDGTDFRTGTVQWAPPEGHDGPWEVRRPTSTDIVDDEITGRVYYSTCLCLSDAPADCTGFKWPARLLVVEAPDARHDHDHKWVTLTATVVGERPAHEVFGPHGEHVVSFLDALRGMTGEQARTAYAALATVDVAAWAAARTAARVAARVAARDAARDTARDTAWDAARAAALGAADDTAMYSAEDAAWDAAMALIVRDLISREHYDALTRPIRAAGITVHPDDPPLTTEATATSTIPGDQ